MVWMDPKLFKLMSAMGLESIPYDNYKKLPFIMFIHLTEMTFICPFCPYPNLQRSFLCTTKLGKLFSIPFVNCFQNFYQIISKSLLFGFYNIHILGQFLLLTCLNTKYNKVLYKS